jgi:outer membrane receptor protein involved in Fe transport
MLSKSLGGIATAGLLLGVAGAGATNAQTAPPKDSKTVQGVTVTGAASDVRVSIDRKSYDIAKDLQATTGSIGDALRNVPSVEVDAQGNISLRGDPNVTILVDGKPSGMFTGPGRAAALESLPADQVERVEVITNPSADLSPEGTAGVINLITKQIRKPGLAGSLRGAYGSEARQTAGLSGAYNTGRLTLSGDVSLRRDPQKYTAADTRSGLDAGGQPFESRSLSQGRGRGHIMTYRLGGDVDVDKATRISAEVRRADISTKIDRRQAFDGEVPGAAAPLSFEQDGPLKTTRGDTEATLGYRRAFAGDGHTLSVQLRFDETDNDYRQSGLFAGQTPPGTTPFNSTRQAFTQGESQLKVDYARPMPAQGKLKAGLDWRRDDDVFRDFGVLGANAASAVTDPNQTDRFHYIQTISAGYATYEQPLGDLTVLAGLRVEDARIDTHDFAAGARDARDEVSAYPSLHLAWKLGDAQQLTASYSRRIQRPYPSDLNPFAQVNNFIFRAGNPKLEPQQTNSYEAGWQYRNGPTSYLATLFWRDSRGVIVDVTTVRPDGALLLTKENVGRSQSGGLELTAAAKLTKTLSYNASATIYWNRYDASNLGFGARRQGTSLSGRMSLNWQPSANDFAQVSGFLVGDRLTAQGHNTPVGMLNLGYRHKLTEKLSLVATAMNVLSSAGGKVIVDTPTLHDVTAFANDAKSVFIGFSYAFGGRKAPPEQGFDFGGGPGG